MVKIVNFPIDVVQLMVKDGDLDEEAFASVTLNPDVSWAKFILTDDSANANKERIPPEEFDNLIKTGINMPIKMAYGTKDGKHKEAEPIGVITHLKRIKNRIVGLAALWKKERPKDVEYLKEKYNEGEPLDLSWEISYSDVKEENGIRNLIGTSLNATTFVGKPAYKGRTGVTALAEEDEEDNTLEKIEELKKELSEVKDTLADVKEENKALEQELENKQTKFENATQELEELEDLREFKQEVEAERKREERLAEIKEKFAEAGIEKDDEYFEEKAEMLLELNEDSLDFFIQEAIAFAEERASEEENSEDGDSEAEELPNFNDIDTSELSPKELAEKVRELERSNK